MKRRDALLVLIGDLADPGPLGRTALQKAAYFLDARMPLGLEHAAHYYGPFSQVVEAEVQALVTAGLVEEREYRLGFVNQQGFEGRRYEYEVTGAGQQRIAKVRDAYPDAVREIRRFAESLVSVAELDQRRLSVAAKVHYIAEKEQQPLNDTQVTQVATQFGWELSPHEVSAVESIVSALAPAAPDA